MSAGILDEVITIESSGKGATHRASLISRASVRGFREAADVLPLRDFVVVGSVVLFLAVMGLSYLLQSASITRIGYRVQEIRATVDRIEQENSVLRVEIAELERLDRVEQKALSLGLEKPGQLHFLYLDGEGQEPGVPNRQ